MNKLAIILDTVSEVIKYLKKHYNVTLTSEENYNFKQALYEIRVSCGENEKLSLSMQDGTELNFSITYIKKLRQWKLDVEQ